MEKLKKRNDIFNFLLKIFLAALFNFLSVYIVLELEWRQGEFIYSFFKTKMYYGLYNKVVYPLYYWALLGIVCLIGARLDSQKRLKNYSRKFIEIGLFIHVFLLLITKFEETVPDFTLTPLLFNPPPFISIYEQAFFVLAFTSFYFFVAGRVAKIVYSKIELVTTPNLMVCFSLLVIPFFVNNKSALFQYMSLGFVLFQFVKYFKNSNYFKVFRNSFINNNLPLFTIILIGVFFRLWYAQYFVSLGEKSIGIGADGPAYYQSALAFSEWNLKGADFWHSPLYTLYLGFFLFLFGKDFGTIFYCQALIGASVPVIVYLMAKHLWGNRVGFLAGILTAVSHLSIHYSVVINRASLLAVILPLILLVSLKLGKTKNFLSLVVLGFLTANSFYIGPESFLALLGILIFIVLKRGGESIYSIIGLGKWVIVGAMIVILPINLISFQANDRFILSGRDSTTSDRVAFTYGQSPSALKMNEMGFNPVNDFKDSMKVFFEFPGKISVLLMEKLKDELPGFLFDPGGRFLMPLHITLNSFYGANLQFYIYLFTGLGFLILLKDRRIIWQNKGLIVGAIILYGLFSSLVVFGTFRFRAVISPINMIFIALALDSIFLKRERFESDENFKLNGIRPRFFKFSLALVIFGVFIFSLKNQINDQPYKTLKLTRWNTFKKKITETDILTINSNAFVHYDFKNIDLNKNSNFRISFKICRDLMPNRKPFYRLFFDGEFLGKAKKIPPGCSQIIEAFEPKYYKGVIGIVAYISDSGETEKTVPFTIKENTENGKTISIPVVQNLEAFENNELKEFNKLFLDYSRGLMKISSSEILYN